MTTIPCRVAFVHYGKAGGIYTQVAMAKTLRPRGYTVRNSWAEKRGRDWTPEELIYFSDMQGPQLVHNHHINWPENVVDLYLSKGWFVFTFVRHPAEIISSLYFWGQKLSRQGRNPFVTGGIDPLEYSLDDWVFAAVFDLGLRNLWTLPPFINRLSFSDEFSAMNLALFLKQYFSSTLGDLGLTTRHKNASGNPGFNHLVAGGQISIDAINELYRDNDFNEYSKHIELWHPSLKN